MTLRRDRYGPGMFLVLALTVFALFGTPGVQGEVDTGPDVVLLEFVSHPAAAVLPAVIVDIVDQAEVVNVYFAENELRAEISTALASPAEAARYESAQRSGVGMRSLTIARYDIDLDLIARGGGLASPLRI